MSILNFTQYQRAINEASLADYYKRYDPGLIKLAKKVDQMLTDLIEDKKKIDEFVDAITDLADAYADERINDWEDENM